MVKWLEIQSEWPERKPRFWSICNWKHRMLDYAWRHSIELKDENEYLMIPGAVYEAREVFLCIKCRRWWER